MNLIDQLLRLVYLIPQILILIAVIILMTRKNGIIPVLMLIGSIAGILSNVYYSILVPVLLDMNIVDTMTVYNSRVSSAISIFGTLAHVCFAVGLLLLVLEITIPTAPPKK